MRLLVTGSAGHLGEALVRVAARRRATRSSGSTCSPRRTPTVVGLDRRPRRRARGACGGVDAVLHAATLHKPHVGSHTRQDFVDTNVTGTLNLLEEAVAAGASRFVFTSTTSAFGRALTPPPGCARGVDHRGRRARPAQHLRRHQDRRRGPVRARPPRPAACPCLILRTSRFFPEDDDRDDVRAAYDGRQPQGQRAALPPRRPRGRGRARTCSRSSARPTLGFGRYIVSATTPFTRERPRRAARRRARGRARACSPTPTRLFERARLAHVPQHRARLRQRARPRRARLGAALRLPRTRSIALAAGEEPRSELAAAVGAKGYHAEPTGPYTTARR